MLTASAVPTNGTHHDLPIIGDIKREIRQRVKLPKEALSLDVLFGHETELAYRQDFLGLAMQPAGRSLRERLKTAVKRMMRSALRWILMRQVEFNAVLVEYLQESSQALSTLDQNIGELYAAWTAVQQQSDRLAGRQDDIGRRIIEVNDALIACRLRLRRTLEPALAGVSPTAIVPDAAAAPDIDYFLYFNRVRGPREEVLRQHSIYVDYFRDVGEVIDIGCGRGEFVELSATENVPVRGIDTNQDMVEFCQELGLPVIWEEATLHVAERANDSLGGIFMAQVAEHLPPVALAALVRQCWQKLHKGGILLIEAINPACPQALADFHVDPTRLLPIHPQWLQFLLEESRFPVRERVLTCPVDWDDKPAIRTAEPRPAAAPRYRNYALVCSK